MRNHLLIFSLIISLLLIMSTKTLVLSQAPPPEEPEGPTNITGILERAGQFTVLIKLLGSTRLGDQINTQLNNSDDQGITLFAPPDHAFSGLETGTLNSLTDQQKVQLLHFHVIPTFLTISLFQTVSNPVRTQAGDTGPGEFPLNVTTSGGQVNITTGVTNATVANTIYSEDQLAVYQVDKVLLPQRIFAPLPPAPASAPSPPVNRTSPSRERIPTAAGEGAVGASGAVGLAVDGIGNMVVCGGVYIVAVVGSFLF